MSERGIIGAGISDGWIKARLWVNALLGLGSSFVIFSVINSVFYSSEQPNMLAISLIFLLMGTIIIITAEMIKRKC